jgi:probable F420-dependent oxidoreductase
VEAERLGFDSIWAGDHVFYRVDVLQPLHLLTWIAAQTSRVRLGTAIMLSAYLNPVLLAKAAATIDCLSGGRLTLGMSIGGSEAEYRSIGVPIEQRVGRLLECVEIMRRLWREDEVEFAGRYHNIVQGTINPKPAQTGGVPVYFGAGRDAMLRRLARVADGWVGSGGSSIESYVEGVSKLRAFAVERGRDPDSLGFAKLHQVSLAGSKQQAFDMAVSHWHDYYGPRFNIEANVVYGEVEEVGERLRAFAAAECPEVTLALEPSNLDPSQLQLLARAAELANV